MMMPMMCEILWSIDDQIKGNRDYDKVIRADEGQKVVKGLTWDKPRKKIVEAVRACLS